MPGTCWIVEIPVQFSSVAQLCPTFCDPMDCSMPGFPVHHNSQSLLKLMSIESVKPSNHLILCRPLLLLPSIFPSIRIFSNNLVLHIRWPKYLHFSFSISPSNEYSELISFRIDWFDLLAVQGPRLSRKCIRHSFIQYSSQVISLCLSLGPFPILCYERLFLCLPYAFSELYPFP